MTPYIVTFTLSLSSFCIGSLFDKQKMKNAGKIFWIIGIILPCLLAAMRDDSVGIDTLVYQKPFFLIARNYRDSLWGYIDYIKQYEIYIILLHGFALVLQIMLHYYILSINF